MILIMHPVANVSEYDNTCQCEPCELEKECCCNKNVCGTEWSVNNYDIDVRLWEDEESCYIMVEMKGTTFRNLGTWSE